MQAVKFRVFNSNCYSCVSKETLVLTNISRDIIIAVAVFIVKIKKEGGVIMNKTSVKARSSSQGMIGAFGTHF